MQQLFICALCTVALVQLATVCYSDGRIGLAMFASICAGSPFAAVVIGLNFLVWFHWPR